MFHNCCSQTCSALCFQGMKPRDLGNKVLDPVGLNLCLAVKGVGWWWFGEEKNIHVFELLLGLLVKMTLITLICKCMIF